MSGVDVNLFPFDYYASWYAFFMNEHGHVYARYGMRKPKKNQDESLMSAKGLRTVIMNVLSTHKEKEEATTIPPAWKPLFAEKLERLPEKMRSGQSCIHCHHAHQFGKNEMVDYIRSRPYTEIPLPDSIGITFDVDTAHVVKSVTPNSLADKAGIKVNDRIVKADDTRVYSGADLSWLIFKLDKKQITTVEFIRGEEKKTVRLDRRP